MKKGVKGSNQRIIRFSKKWFYGILALGILILVSIGIHAATSGSFTPDSNGNFYAPVPGHSISEISPPNPCTNGQFLELEGTGSGGSASYTWNCVTPSAPSESDNYLPSSFASSDGNGGPEVNWIHFLGSVPSGLPTGGNNPNVVLLSGGCVSSVIGMIAECAVGSGVFTGDCECVCVQIGGTSGCQKEIWAPMSRSQVVSY